MLQREEECDRSEDERCPDARCPESDFAALTSCAADSAIQSVSFKAALIRLVPLFSGKEFGHSANRGVSYLAWLVFFF